MTDTRVAEIIAWEALDSRGRPTVACHVSLVGGGEGRAVVPSGASTGGHEAHELRDGEERYDGYGTKDAVRNLNQVLAPAVLGLDPALLSSAANGQLAIVDGIENSTAPPTSDVWALMPCWPCRSP